MSATVFFKHKYIKNLGLTPAGKIVNAIDNVTTALRGSMPTSLHKSSHQAIQRLQVILNQARLASQTDNTVPIPKERKSTNLPQRSPRLLPSVTNTGLIVAYPSVAEVPPSPILPTKTPSPIPMTPSSPRVSPYPRVTVSLSDSVLVTLPPLVQTTPPAPRVAPL